MSEEPLPRATVPYASAYGVDNLRLQEALRNAAVIALDEFDEGARRLEAGDAFEDTFLDGMLPRAFAPHYDRRFLSRFRVCLVVVGWKLAQAECHPLSCLAEELALNALIAGARDWLEVREEPVPEADIADLYDSAFEDTDFEYLFEMRHATDSELVDPTNQLGVGHLPFYEWFKPFGDGVDRGVPHPLLWPPESDEPQER